MDTWTYEEFKEAIQNMLFQRMASVKLEVESKEEAINIKSWAEQYKMKTEICDGYVEVSIF